jgi:hypothetical protein
MVALHDGVSRMLWSGAWDALFSPVLAAPAWVALLAIVLLCFLVGGMRPGRGWRAAGSGPPVAPRRV